MYYWHTAESLNFVQSNEQLRQVQAYRIETYNIVTRASSQFRGFWVIARLLSKLFYPDTQSDNNAMMAFQEDLPLPQGQGLKRRVEMNVTKATGHLGDQSLDLDARTLAVLGKRQQLKV